MAVTYIQPYRPASTARTATDDAVDVGLLRDMANAINNAKARVFAPVIQEMWPQSAANAASEFSSKPSSTAEVVIGHCGPIGLAFGLNALLWTISGRRHGSAAGTTTWRLYISTKMYNGAETINDGAANHYWRLGNYVVGARTISSATHAHSSAIISSLPHLSFRQGWLTFTAQNSASGANEYSWLTGTTATFILSGTT